MLKGALENMPVFASRSLRRDRIVETILANVSAASTWVAGKLMDGKEGGAGFVKQDRFRAIAMMHVKIVNRDSFGARSERFQHGDRSIAQITKTHCSLARSVMTGWAHQREDSLAGAGAFERLKRRPCGIPGIFRDARKKRRIRIEILRFLQP